MDASDSGGDLASLLRGLALGAVAMYLLDPDKGRRRRALARDKLASFACDSGAVFAAAAHDLRNRARGARATAVRGLHRAATPDDLQLIERVRARIGRAVSNPHAIQVGARDGRVTLSGPVLAGEVDALLEAAHATPGTVAVDDHLAVHTRAGSIPSLQGTGQRPRRRPPMLADPDAPVMRAGTIAGGTLLAAYGISRGSWAGLALAALGAGLAAQGARRAPNGRSRATATAGEARNEVVETTTGLGGA
jgi:hypothetical protein